MLTVLLHLPVVILTRRTPLVRGNSRPRPVRVPFPSCTGKRASPSFATDPNKETVPFWVLLSRGHSSNEPYQLENATYRSPLCCTRAIMSL